MRVRFSKVYRGFHQLDGFSDADCSRYCQSIYRREKLRYVAPAVFTILLLPAVGITIGLLAPFGHGLVLSAIVIVIPIMGLAAMNVRDRAIRQALHERISLPHCPKCEFSLQGLPVAEGATRCPECGEDIVLAEHLLTECDLRTQTGVATAASEGPA